MGRIYRETRIEQQGVKVNAIYQKLEKEYTLTLDIYEYLKGVKAENEEDERIIRFERTLLDSDVEPLMTIWTEETKVAVRDYCSSRLQEAESIYLKAKYGWNLWPLTGKSDYRLLNDTVDNTLTILESFLEEDDFDHADIFCHYMQKVYAYKGLIGRNKNKILIQLLDKAIRSDNEHLRFQLLATINDEETAEDSNGDGLLQLTSVQFLAETAMNLANAEENDRILERKLELAVYFADRTNDTDLKRTANEKLGDYKMDHLYPDDEENLMIAHLNDHLLEGAMAYYKKAGNTEKLKKATLSYEENKPKLRYPRLTHSISAEERNKQIDLMNQHIKDVVEGGTQSILDSLFGRKIDVFVSADIIKEICGKKGEGFSYQQYFGAVNKDSFQNSLHTTHEKTLLHLAADSTYRNCTFHVFALIICNGMKEETFTYDILKDELLSNGFNLELYKWNADGTKIGTTYLERVDVGLKDFMDTLFKSINGEDVDWRYCTTFLTTQFEGLFRDVLKKLGEPIDRIKNNGDTELIPLEGLLNSEKARVIFNSNDLLLFNQTFTKDGYNIRNDIAHGLLLLQEFTATKALLVFLCVLRLTKATKAVVEVGG